MLTPDWFLGSPGVPHSWTINKVSKGNAFQIKITLKKKNPIMTHFMTYSWTRELFLLIFVLAKIHAGSEMLRVKHGDVILKNNS